MPLLSRILNLFSRSKLAGGINDELQTHIDMRVSDSIASGMSPDQARRDALLRFGTLTVTKERGTASDTALTLESIGMDIRHGFCRLAQSPGLSIAAILRFHDQFD